MTSNLKDILMDIDRSTIRATFLLFLAFGASTAAFAQPSDKRCSVGANAGFALLDDSFSVDEGQVELLFDPSDDGTIVGANLSCYLAENWFVTGEYQYVDATEIDFSNWLASINYGWKVGQSGIAYLGAVAGWSTLEWQDAPIETLEQEPESEQAAFGVQAGYAHEFVDSWYVNVRYFYLATNHKTSLKPSGGSAKYYHDSIQGLTLGIDWRF
ncbi:MAG: outer membrane beta-barrel protein [Halioglobus sp.]